MAISDCEKLPCNSSRLAFVEVATYTMRISQDTFPPLQPIGTGVVAMPDSASRITVSLF